jgi:hypothetical protein
VKGDPHMTLEQAQEELRQHERENERMRERTARRRAKRLGLLLRKSRVKTTNLDDYGLYMLIDVRRSICVAGSRFDLSLEDAATWIDKAEGQMQ